MLFNSIQFLLFFPTVAIVFFLIPNRIRYIWLLVCSYYFYMNWNVKYASLLLLSTCVTYLAGILIKRFDDSEELSKKKDVKKKIVIFIAVAVNIGILFFFKYFNFFADNINLVSYSVFSKELVPKLDILLPVGISFYTFQALGYIIDVYRGEIEPERNILKYALFVSFFPQLVAGPIERSKNLLTQINNVHSLKFTNIKTGFLWMFWGYFLKLVLADRIAIIVDYVYGDISAKTGAEVIMATVLFAFQIYCDFNGYTMIARGCAKIMDFELMENFNAPYCAASVSEFWRRWHISLSSWFKDYVYIPLGGNRKGKKRKYLNLLCVFALSGIWHGADWGYVIWGVLNGLYQIAGGIVSDVFRKINVTVKRNWISTILKPLKIILTFILIDFSWIFFRSKTIKTSIEAISKIFGCNKSCDINLNIAGFQQNEIIFLAAMILILVVADIAKYNKINITELVLKQHFILQSFVYIILIWTVLLMGIYGADYDSSGFIYFQF